VWGSGGKKGATQVLKDEHLHCVQNDKVHILPLHLTLTRPCNGVVSIDIDHAHCYNFKQNRIAKLWPVLN
jgi:hypothetical protein